MRREDLDAVVKIHLAGMGYTFNARLGANHLQYLYEEMAHDPTCYVGVAHDGAVPTGVVSGSLDADALATRLLRQMRAGRLFRTAARLLTRPWLLRDWIQSRRIAAPVHVDDKEVRAVLTAIIVDDAAARKGLGRQLVEAFEQFLRMHGVRAYKLDTRIENTRAEKFYRGIGFIEYGRRADSIVFIRRLS